MCYAGVLIWRQGSQCGLPWGVAMGISEQIIVKHLELALTHGVYSVHASPVIYLSVLLLCLESALLPFCYLPLGNHVTSVSSSTASWAWTTWSSQVLALLDWWMWHCPSLWFHDSYCQSREAQFSSVKFSSIQSNPIQFNSSIPFSASHSFHLFTNISWGPRHA